MEGLITFIAQNPSSALIVIALGLACLFAYLLFQNFKTQIGEAKTTAEKFTDKMDGIKESLEAKLQSTNLLLNSHREDMGKATKAINGDMLVMKEKVFELKQDLILEIAKVQGNTQETGRALELARETSKLAIDNLNEKLGRVILIEKNIEIYGAQITKLQEGVGQNSAEYAKSKQWFVSIAQALKAHKEQLEAIKRDQKKGPKNEV